MTPTPQDLPAATPDGRDAAPERTPVARAAAPGTAFPARRARGPHSSPEPPVPGRGTGAREERPDAVLRTGAGPSPASDPAAGAREQDAAPSAGTTWTIELPAGLKLLTQNDRLHYAERNRIFQSLKKAAWAMTINARVPRLERVVIGAVYDPPDRRHRDPDNWTPSLKAAIDGIVAAGRLPGDDERYVAGVWCEIGSETFPRGRLRLIIREVAP